MYLDLDRKKSDAIAMCDSKGLKVSYGDIVQFSETLHEVIGDRTLIFVLCHNCIGAAIGYLGALCNHIVPLLLSASIDGDLLQNLISCYRPEYIWKPIEDVTEIEKVCFSDYGYALISTGMSQYDLYQELSLLLTTSGSTGSPKLVRHSYRNLEEQAKNIAIFFELNDAEKPMLDLPINYTYGLSVLNSHLYVGATVLLSDLHVLDPEYWKFIKKYQATSLTNVPYYYEILKKLRFFQMNLPSIKVISQGGGRLSDELYKEYAEFAVKNGKKFIPTYGQTEGSARMAYLPAELSSQKCGSIGYAIPNGRLYLIDEEGNNLDKPNVIGEMVYEGPNVTLGYAQSREDLLLGDERHGVLHTGDMAKKDEDGCFYIVGRKKRFLKLWGYRVGLDECENLIKSAFEVECACTGDDKCMQIFVTSGEHVDEIKKYISNKTNINSSAFQVHYIESIPRNEAGKILYSKLVQ